LFEEKVLLFAFLVSHFFATMFYIICVNVCEIVVWYDEMAQFRNCSFGACTDVCNYKFDFS